ncbi:hypothetical protein KFL_000310220 [Klebsormidium nitens]|uniref:Uncharacterized protein n=1 Tax=Klebsormidium nitens TaxID=105231 RepID=A0A1Y1HR63_KLENI|nr:hypothetical protein KFL_000310220 [Klebsormidium nitens]|eukprot:GAQ79471.1 hypothetical protein KFL_000310220 [Klebsormidium nitens]
MRVLETSTRKGVIEVTIQVLKGVIHDEGEALKVQTKDACDFFPLVALATSSAVPKAMTAQAVVILCFFDESVKRSRGPSMEAILLDSLYRQQHGSLEPLAERRSKILKRKKQLEEIFQAQGSSTNTQTFVGLGSDPIKDASSERGDNSFEMEPEHPSLSLTIEHLGSFKKRRDGERKARKRGAKGAAIQAIKSQSQRDFKAVKKEFEERVTEKETVSLDLLKPQSSKWLEDIHKELSSDDAETRLIALWRFKAVHNRVAVFRGPAACAEFTTFALQKRLVLAEIVRLLRAAQVHGDLYFFPLPRDSLEIDDFFSKTQLCFGLLNTLMMDSRAVRHVRKAIPDLIDLQEASYCAEALCDSGFGEVLDAHQQSQNKKAVLSSMVALATFSEQAKAELGKRTAFLRQVLVECTEADGSEDMTLDCAMLLVLHLRGACPFSELAQEIVRLAMRVLGTSMKREVIQVTMAVLKKMLRIEREALKVQISDACDFFPLLALAISSAVPKELTAPAVEILCFVEESLEQPIESSIETILLNLVSRQQHVSSRSLDDESLKLLERKEQFEKMFKVQGSGPIAQPPIGLGSEAIEYANCQKRAWKEGHREECTKSGLKGKKRNIK